MSVRHTFFGTMLVCASIVVSSCGGNKDEAELSNIVTDSLKTDSAGLDMVEETFYQVPSPGEMLVFIKAVGGKNNKNTAFLNPADNQSKYSTTKQKALNFGVYCCDLSYCSIFEIGEGALKYFKTVKKLGDEIGVSNAIQPEVLKRLEGNISKPDSLAVITDDIYFHSFETLENGKQGSTLSLVMAGGWIESMYIASNLSKYDPKNALTHRFADQKYTLENLIGFLEKHASNPDVNDILKSMRDLQSEFAKIVEKEVTSAAAPNKGSKLKTLGGSKELVISAEQYQTIVSKIKDIRNSITLNQ